MLLSQMDPRMREDDGGVRPDREIHDIFDLRQAGCLTRNDGGDGRRADAGVRPYGEIVR